MRKLRNLGLVGVLVVMVGVVALPASADDAEVKHQTHLCSVGWSLTDNPIDPECEIVNVSRANGGYTLVVHGQVPDGDLATFQASGVRHYATSCFAAFLFVVQDGHAPVFVDSVRHFTPDGKMTETCNYKIDA